MDYARVLGSIFSWISLRKVFWFLVFFWISLPVVLYLPQFLGVSGFFAPQFLPFVYLLYGLMYAVLIVGFITLLQQCMLEKKLFARKLTLSFLFELIVLVFLELYYIFVWNLNRKFRSVQLLLIIACSLMFYYLTVIISNIPFNPFLSGDALLVLNLFSLCLTAYFIIVVYNCVRFFFTSTIFFNSNNELSVVLHDSWALTHNRFYELFISLAVIVVGCFVLFSFIVIILGVLTSLVLRFFFINPIAVSFGFRVAALFAFAPAVIAYHYAVTEAYSQISSHNALSTKIRHVLSHRVLHPSIAKPVAKRSFSKKKIKKRK
jgi:hypothetical protein